MGTGVRAIAAIRLSRYMGRTQRHPAGARPQACQVAMHGNDHAGELGEWVEKRSGVSKIYFYTISYSRLHVKYLVFPLFIALFMHYLP